MSFSSPLWFLALLLIPAVFLAMRWQRSRARRYAIRFTAVSALREAAAATPAWRSILPVALLAGAMAAMVFAIADPHVTEAVPTKRATVVLVVDHSGSMQATDVSPTRLGAAQKAADTFVDKLPDSTQLGIVAYSTTADTVQAPTTKHGATKDVINSLQAEGGTATGEALQSALDMVKANARNQPTAIVLLSDGATTVGRDPVPVATEAGKAKVPVYTVALGTEDATIPNPNDPMGQPLVVAPDPETLQAIAKASGARAFTAESGSELSSIYQRLGSQLGSTERERQVGEWFAGGALLLLAGAGLAAVAGAGRLP